jgi:hypothetical protein
MSYVPTGGNEILVDTPDNAADKKKTRVPGGALTGWLSSRATKWRDHRNNGYKRIWADYWRLWRGKWSQEDRNRESERSRLIAPALANAIEMTVSEIEEGLFSKEVWFDIPDNLSDEEKSDAIIARDLLREDLDQANVKDCFSEAVLCSAIFGTGIIKMNVEVVTDQNPVRNPNTLKLEPSQAERVLVTAESIRPDEFIPDPSGRNITEMLGCFHEVKKPLHSVLEKIKRGVYRADALPYLHGSPLPRSAEIDPSDPQAMVLNSTDEVRILEYHGKVPAEMLATVDIENPLDALLASQDGEPVDGGPMVEAIVTIANDGILLRAVASPFVMKDRSIIAFQHEKVPGRFWGRGVAEKGYNPQKALDVEIRSRQDALGFISAPMLGVDYGRIPRGFKMGIKPGKLWLTQGNPNEVLSPVKIGDINPNTFNQASEMERMVQMGTGAFDTASVLTSQGSNSSGPSASNVSASMGAFVKRSKRSIRNVNDNAVRPFIKKAMWRYMQFAPRRYPQDYEFNVKASLGIVAREVEAMQMTQVMAMLPEEIPQLRVVVAKGIIDLSSMHNKAEILNSFNQALQPPSPEEQAQQEAMREMQFAAAMAEAQQSLLENQQIIANIRATLAEAAKLAREADVEDIKTQQEQQRIQVMWSEVDNMAKQNDIAQKRLELADEQLTFKKQEAAKKRSE